MAGGTCAECLVRVLASAAALPLSILTVNMTPTSFLCVHTTLSDATSVCCLHLSLMPFPLPQVLVELFQSDIKLWQAYVRALRVRKQQPPGHHRLRHCLPLLPVWYCFWMCTVPLSILCPPLSSKRAQLGGVCLSCVSWASLLGWYLCLPFTMGYAPVLCGSSELSCYRYSQTPTNSTAWWLNWNSSCNRN